jgi:hypothetical protein
MLFKAGIQHIGAGCDRFMAAWSRSDANETIQFTSLPGWVSLPAAKRQ